MRDDFCAFILTHGRPDKVITYRHLRRAGYTGKIFIVIDDEDTKAGEYCDRFGDDVLIFSKEEIAREFDQGDNFVDRRVIFYARNACFKLAKQQGYKYFIQLDDDYKDFMYTMDNAGRFLTKSHWVKNMDGVLEAMVDFLEKTSAVTVAMAQGGDFIGGAQGGFCQKLIARKAMNTFVCSVSHPFQFHGRINEDVNTYTMLGRQGKLFFTIVRLRINQNPTQSSKGGMTEVYLDSGTYVKSFYSVMYCPSSVKIGVVGYRSYRLHHKINWRATVPLIVREEYKKGK